ncbi:MAG: hypothetical protein FWE58_00385 [Methanobrevibacter sp.]|nr:hypothetical protein [Methanobrevibacter sp.]
MIIVTTPMCEKILEFAGINEYKVNKNPDEEKGDLAILLSESKIKMKSLKIKLNTFSQIRNSIIEVSRYRNYEFKDNLNESKDNLNESKNEKTIENNKLMEIFSDYPLASEWLNLSKKKEFQEKNSKTKVKVYSKFLLDIVNDMGFDIIDSDSFDGVNSGNFDDIIIDVDYIVYPDYMDISEDNFFKNKYNKYEYKFIPVPTHNNIHKDPIKRAELRYSLLSNI